MFMPAPGFAIDELAFGEEGKVLLFPSCELEYMSSDHPYYESLERLSKCGLHRNVFLVGPGDTPIWQVGDYKQILPDYIAGPSRSNESVVATTFHGLILEVDFASGSAKRIGRTKA